MGVYQLHHRRNLVVVVADKMMKMTGSSNRSDLQNGVAVTIVAVVVVVRPLMTWPPKRFAGVFQWLDNSLMGHVLTCCCCCSC